MAKRHHNSSAYSTCLNANMPSDTDAPTAAIADRTLADVTSDDIEALAPRVLQHRVELAPGVTDFDEVLRECLVTPLEALARSTLRKRA